MPVLLTRRHSLLILGAVGIVAAIGVPLPAAAQSGDAAGFVRRFADQLISIVNGPQPYERKKQALGPIIDANVDVPRIARFCLGGAWNTATPAQRQQYSDLFHQVLLNNIAGHLGEYQGVSYTMGGARTQGADALVMTTINRPGAPAADVQWVVDSSSGSPKVVDVVAEGTSLRITQRSDYTSYLNRHGQNIDALIAALRRQLAAS